jgi:hypothetical protein
LQLRPQSNVLGREAGQRIPYRKRCTGDTRLSYSVDQKFLPVAKQSWDNIRTFLLKISRQEREQTEIVRNIINLSMNLSSRGARMENGRATDSPNRE